MPTRRQEIIGLLGEREYSFEELKRELQITVRELETDLQHVERSLRRGRTRLLARPPRCAECDFRFKDRLPARFASPGRCPRCRSERIHPAWLRIEEG